MLAERESKKEVNSGLLLTFHIALKNFAVDVFAVGPVGRLEIFSDGCQNRGGHGILTLSLPAL
jgi:hypothetical protein